VCVLCEQKLNQELQEALEDREGLKVQVQEYILEVRRVEDALSAKVAVTLSCHSNIIIPDNNKI